MYCTAVGFIVGQDGQDDVGNTDGRLKDVVSLQMGFGEIRKTFPIDIFKD